MFSISGYVPFCDVADMCFEAAYTFSSDGKRPRIPVFEGWEGLDEWSRERVVRTIAALFEDMVIQLPKRFALISVGGRVVRPSNRILALQDSSIETSLAMPVAAFHQFGSRRSSRYTFLDTWTWCVKRKPFDPADVDVDDEGNAYTDPEDDIVSSFVGFALAVSEVDAPKDAEALLQELLAAAAVKRKSPGFVRPRGRPPVQDAVRSYYFSKYPNGHSHPTTWADIRNELATVNVKAGLTTIRNAINGTQQFDKSTREMPESGI